MILIYFHAAIIFVPNGLPLIQNAETSTILEIFTGVSHQFRLALLFFISGVGVAFARRHRTDREFISERSRRLLIPLLFGVLVVIPPMVYLEKTFLGAIDTSFTMFYPTFFTDGVYPKGNLSWHHMWFIAYLYLFCVFGLRIFKRLDKSPMVVEITELSAPMLYGFIPVLFVPELFLRPLFPGFRDLIHDWASVTHWFLIFLAGMVFANHRKLLDKAAQLRFASLGITLVCTYLLWLLYGNDLSFDLHDIAPNRPIPMYVLWCFLRMTMVWCAILTCIGMATAYVNFNNPVLSYLNEAVYPLFILHLTVITALGYCTVELEWNLWAKYLFITSATLVIILIAFHWLIRPYSFMRLLFGLKPIPTLAKAVSAY